MTPNSNVFKPFVNFINGDDDTTSIDLVGVFVPTPIFPVVLSPVNVPNAVILG